MPTVLMPRRPRRHLARAALCLTFLAGIATDAAAGDALPFTVAWSTPADTVTQQRRLDSYGLLPDGRAVFLGIPAAAPTTDAKAILLFDPATDAWVWKSLLPVAIRTYPSALMPLADGRILVMGKTAGSAFPNMPWNTYLYDPATDAFTNRATMTLPSGAGWEPTTRIQRSADTLLISGGSADTSTQAACFIYTLSSNSWTTGPQTPLAFSHTANFYRGMIPLGQGRYWRAGTRLASATFMSAAIFDANAGTWTMSSSDTLVQSLDFPALIQDAVYGAGIGTAGNLSAQLIKQRLADGTFEVIENRTNVSQELRLHTFRLRAAGRDYLCTASSTPAGSASFGRVDASVLDPVSNAWTALPQSPTAIMEVNNYSQNSVQLNDGFLIITARTTGAVKSQRLRLTSGTAPVAPFVDPVGMPTALALDEGSSTVISYRVVGDIPPAGVTVVVERSQGDGDVRVIETIRDPILANNVTRSARIIALIDADAVNDTAAIRLRVVQTGGGADPKAITIPVTVTDRYQEISHKSGDVNGDGVVNALDLDQVVESFGQ